MSKISYYLRKKLKNKEHLNHATALRENINAMLKQLSDWGYETSTVSEVSGILKRPNGHSIFLEENKENEIILLVSHSQEWKPVFNLGNGYDNLVAMNKWYQVKEIGYEIVCEENQIQTVLTWDEFIEKVKSYKWTKFGMPKKYNKQEETIWEWLR